MNDGLRHFVSPRFFGATTEDFKFLSTSNPNLTFYRQYVRTVYSTSMMMQSLRSSVPRSTLRSTSIADYESITVGVMKRSTRSRSAVTGSSWRRVVFSNSVAWRRRCRFSSSGAPATDETTRPSMRWHFNAFYCLLSLLNLLIHGDSLTATTNSNNADYPWMFKGRLWARPAFVKIPSVLPSPSVSILSIFDWTLGGVVALEYDESPVGPYREYVAMGALVSKRGAIGQWGSQLYVSNAKAEQICQEIWKVPAIEASIDFVDDGSTLRVGSAPDSASQTKQRIVVNGWDKTRTVQPDEGAAKPRGGLPMLWTPSIKALWAPFVPFSSSSFDTDELPLHKLRISASFLKLCWCGQEPSSKLGVPLSVGLSVDNLLIEIGPEFGTL